MTVQQRNSIISRVWWVISFAALAILVAVLLAIFWFVAVRGFPALKFSLFFTVTSGLAGGLANAIAGTVLLTVIGLALVIFFGIGAGVWIVEVASPRGRQLLRFTVDVLAGVPSIVVGYFLYVALVEGLGWGFSLIAGSVALAIIMLPYVVRAADLALSTVPTELREGAIALGARPTVVLFSIAFPWALPGITTGLLVATGIALGETAPLIYTAGWSSFMPSLAPTHSPVGYLTYVVWTFISQPSDAAHALAYAAAALLMVLIFATNLVARGLVESWAARTLKRS